MFLVSNTPAAGGLEEGALSLSAPRPAKLNSPQTASRTGVINHGEHLADLILFAACHVDNRHGNAFRDIILRLAANIASGSIDVINEKFDGSPSLVLGFDSGGDAFIAYKGGVTRKGPQQLIHTAHDAQIIYEDKPDLRKTFKHCARYIVPNLASLSGTALADYTIQGDLLFIPGNGSKSTTGKSIRIKANQIEYEIGRDSEYFAAASDAKVGLVLHTLGKRVLDPATGRISSEPVNDPRLIEEAVKLLRSKELFVIDPYRRAVNVSGPKNFSVDVMPLLRTLLKDIELNCKVLSTSFRDEWAAHHLSRFQRFFNSHLRPPNDGGIYRAAANGEEFAAKKLVTSFNEWLDRRVNAEKRLEPSSYVERYRDFAKELGTELRAVLRAYYDAIRVQYLMAPALGAALRSKLGGGELEGVMLESGNFVVKLVDRLGFTIKNNVGWDRDASKRKAPPFRSKGAARPVSTAEIEPFRDWHPGAVFVIAKFQPPHRGHIEMILRAQQLAKGAPVYIIASDKAPNLKAENWRELGATNTKKDLMDGNFTHVFSRRLRKELLSCGLGADVPVYFASPLQFWSYVRNARDSGKEGKVRLVMGEKEVVDGRFASQLRRFKSNLEPMVSKMQADGISASEVREALRRFCETRSPDALCVLHEALSYVAEPKRNKIIDKMVTQWETLASRAAILLGN